MMLGNSSKGFIAFWAKNPEYKVIPNTKRNSKTNLGPIFKNKDSD